MEPNDDTNLTEKLFTRVKKVLETSEVSNSSPVDEQDSALSDSFIDGALSPRWYRLLRRPTWAWQGADPGLVHVAAELGAGYVVSHTGGAAPRTDPDGVAYGPPGQDGAPRDDPDDVVADVIRILTEGANRARPRRLHR